MSSLQSRLWWGGVLAALALAVFFSVGQAQQADNVEVPSLLPKDSVLFVTWDGSEAHADAWANTAAYDAIYKTGLIEVFHKILKYAGEQAGPGQEFAVVKRLVERVGASGFSVAVTVAGEGPPLPQGILVLHDAAELQGAVSELVQDAAGGDLQFESSVIDGLEVTHALIPGTPGVEFGWFQAGNHLALVAGMNATQAMAAVAAGKAPNITEHPLYQKYREGADGFEVASLGWLELQPLRERFGPMPLSAFAPVPNPDLTVLGVLEAFGVDSLDSMVWQAGYRGRTLWSESHVLTHGERTGLMALVDQEPITLDDLPPIPFSTTGFHACSLDASGMYDNLVGVIRNVSKLGPPDTAAQVEGMLAQLPDMIGLDPKADLLDTLGNVFCAYGDPRQGSFGVAFGVAISVKDPERLRATINKLAQMAATMSDPTELTVSSTTKQGREIITFELGGGFLNPAVAVDDKWLVIGIVPQTVEAFLMRLDGNLTRWEPTKSYQMAFDELPQEFTSITAMDPRKSYRTLLGVAPMIMGFARGAMTQSGMGTQLPITVADLPPAEAVARPLFPNVSVCTVDEFGVHSVSRTSLPAFPTLGGVQNMTVAPVLVALLLPAVQSARSAARRTQSSNNLKQIGLALHNYHDTFNTFPSGTIENEKLDVEERLSWLVTILPFIEQINVSNSIDQEKGWQDEANSIVSELSIPVYLHPSQPVDPSEPPPTHYVGISGWGEDSANLPKSDPRAGIFGYNRKTKLRDITDGTSNTMMVSEAVSGFDSWAAGGPGTVRGFETRPYINGPDGIGSQSPGGCNVLFADGSVRFISDSIDPETVERLAAMHDGQPIEGF